MFRVCLLCALSGVLSTTAMAQGQEQSDSTSSQSSRAQQQQQQSQQAQPGSFRRSSSLSADALYRGWRARELIGQEVSDEEGQELGSLHDIIVDSSGRVSAIVVEGGGVTGAPEAVYRVPWQSVDLTEGERGVTLTSSGESLNYTRQPGQSGVATWPREYRLSEVIGDNARLKTGGLYGYVTDVVLSQDGRVAAVLVAPDASVGQKQTVAFPFHGRTTGRWDPGSSYFGLPYVTAEQARQAGMTIDPSRFAHAQGRNRSSDMGLSPPENSEMRDDTSDEGSSGQQWGRRSDDQSFRSQQSETQRSGRAQPESRRQNDQAMRMQDDQDDRQSRGDRIGRMAAAESDRQTQSGQQFRSLLSPDANSVKLPSLSSLYAGRRVSRLIDQTVYGKDGESLGEVHDVIADADGKITAIVVEGGGFLDIGDSHFRVPWQNVSMTPKEPGVKVDFTKQQATERGLFDKGEVIGTGAREFRLSELLNDYAVLQDGYGYGYVDDAVIDDDGKIVAVLINRDVRYGPAYYAYPYYGYRYGWRPGDAYYAIPFSTIDEASRGTQVDKQRFADASASNQQRSRRQGSSEGSASSSQQPSGNDSESSQSKSQSQ